MYWFCSELYHAQRWHTEFPSPMLVSKVGRVFVKDFITFHHDGIGNTQGKVAKIFLKVCCCC